MIQTATPEEIRERIDRLRQMGSVPIRRDLGIRTVAIDHEQIIEEMDVGTWLHDERGQVAPGSLGLLVDAVLGRGVMVAVPIDMTMATSHLHIELLRPIPGDATVIRCVAAPRAIEDSFGLSEGEVVADNGAVVARASLGAILLPQRQIFSHVDGNGSEAGSTAVTAKPVRPHRLIAGSPIHQALATRVISARASGVRVTNPAAPRWANLSLGVFGGIGVLMGERTMDLALRVQLDGAVAMRPVELRAAYMRPIPADGSLITSHAQVMYRGRRLAVVRAEVRGPDGRVAVLVDGSYIPTAG